MHHPQLKFSARSVRCYCWRIFYPALVSLESLKCENTAEVMTRRTWKNHSSFFRTGMGHNGAMGARVGRARGELAPRCSAHKGRREMQDVDGRGERGAGRKGTCIVCSASNFQSKYMIYALWIRYKIDKTATGRLQTNLLILLTYLLTYLLIVLWDGAGVGVEIS